MVKPKIGIYGLTGCAGDQLNILNCEDELLDIMASVDLKSFIMAQTGNQEDELDIAFVEGAVCQERDRQELLEIRERCGLLIAIGTCAVWGGVAAMRNDLDRQELADKVYNGQGGFLHSLEVKPLAAYVKVDFNITGCPIEKDEFLQSVSSLLHGDIPVLPKYPVCTSCKMKEYECVLVKRNMLCLGPITVSGCGARCPGLNLACKGCRGLVDQANITSEVNLLKNQGFSLEDIRNQLSTYAASADEVLAELIKGREDS